MLSIFFNPFKPIHYIIIVALTIMGVIAGLCWFNNTDLWAWSTLLIVPAIIAVLEFINTKNQLTPKSSYALWISSSLLLLIVPLQINYTYLMALLLMILALRRLLSLASGKVVISKIFDASLWIALATTCYHWCLLFYIMIYIAIFIHARNDYRHWITPIISLCCIWIGLATYDYVWDHQFIDQVINSFNINYLWKYNNPNTAAIVPALIAIIAIIGVMYYLIKFGQLQQSIRPKYTLLLWSGIIGLFIAVIDITSFVNGGYILLIPSVTVFIATLCHNRQHILITELLLWIPVVFVLCSLLLV